MKEVMYPTQGTCSRFIHVVLDDNNTIVDAQIIGGCSGNTQGVCQLVKGQNAHDVISRVKGIRCGARPTSCPDQLAMALQKAMESA